MNAYYQNKMNVRPTHKVIIMWLSATFYAIYDFSTDYILFIISVR